MNKEAKEDKRNIYCLNIQLYHGDQF